MVNVSNCFVVAGNIKGRKPGTPRMSIPPTSWTDSGPQPLCVHGGGGGDTCAYGLFCVAPVVGTSWFSFCRLAPGLGTRSAPNGRTDCTEALHETVCNAQQASCSKALQLCWPQRTGRSGLNRTMSQCTQAGPYRRNSARSSAAFFSRSFLRLSSGRCIDPLREGLSTRNASLCMHSFWMWTCVDKEVLIASIEAECVHLGRSRRRWSLVLTP
jgi:hypothetical protein